MRFAFTEEQGALRAAVRGVLERRCTPSDLRAVAEDRRAGGNGEAGRAAERWRDLCDLGAPGLLVPEGDGGLGLGEVEAVGVCEEVGRSALPEPLVESAVLASPLLVRAVASAGDGRVDLARALSALARGEAVATVGGVEPVATGSIVNSSDVDRTGKVVTRHVAGAGRADLFLLVRDDPDAGSRSTRSPPTRPPSSAPGLSIRSGTSARSSGHLSPRPSWPQAPRHRFWSTTSATGRPWPPRPSCSDWPRR